MSEGREWLDIDIHIRRVADGEVRVCRDRARVDGWRFQWGEGNYSCDCNRYLYFERARERATDPIDDDYECGEKAYVVEKIIAVESGEVLIDEDPRT